MKKSKRLVFFGNERLATAVSTSAPVLRGLVHAGYEIPAVITNYTPGVSRDNRRLEIVEVAHAYHIPVLMPDKPLEIIDKIRHYGAEAAVLVAYGRIIPQAIIDVFPKVIVNLHPSLLPKYRGATPIETTILDGASETGVSLMQLVAEMDAGPVFTRQKINLAGDETKQALADKLIEVGAELLVDELPRILDGRLQPQLQNYSEATYTRLLKKDDGLMDFNKPAERLEREVRAYLDWPRSVARVFDQKIIVTKARVTHQQGDNALIMEANPGYLEIVELIAPTGRTISGADFLRGYKK